MIYRLCEKYWQLLFSLLEQCIEVLLEKSRMSRLRGIKQDKFQLQSFSVEFVNEYILFPVALWIWMMWLSPVHKVMEICHYNVNEQMDTPEYMSRWLNNSPVLSKLTRGEVDTFISQVTHCCSMSSHLSSIVGRILLAVQYSVVFYLYRIGTQIIHELYDE